MPDDARRRFVSCDLQKESAEAGPGLGREVDYNADLLVVGAGPSGLFAAYYAGFRGLRVAVVDSLDQPGGQVAALYPEKLIHDVAGFPAIRGQDLVDNLLAQAQPYGPTYHLGEVATELECFDDGVVVGTKKGRKYRARGLLITGGVGSFAPRRLPVAGSFEGRGLMYFVPRLADVAGMDVVIVGGGDSACDWAVALQDVARCVSLVHRRDQFRAHEGTVKQVQSSATSVLTPYEVAEVRGEERLEQVVLNHVETGERVTVEAQALVAALGFIAHLGPVAQWGLELRDRKLVVDRTMRTSRPRVYAAGDITTYDGKLPLIAVGFGEAATAVNNLLPVIRPGEAAFPGHSTDV